MSAVNSRNPIDVLLWPLMLLAGTLLVLAIAIRLSGQAPLPALVALWQGAFGSSTALASTIARSSILALNALGIALSFRAGLLNIGAEGQSRVAAAIATTLSIGAIGATLGNLPVLGMALVLLGSALAGALWSLFAGVLRHWRGAPEVITTLMLNFIALLLVKYLVSNPALLRDKPVFNQSEVINDGLRLSGWAMTEFHAGVFLLVPVMLAIHFFLHHTPRGFRLRAMGLNATAAQATGANVSRLALVVFALSGALAGLAGGLGLLARGRLDMEPTYPDYGFMAIAVALLADLRPAWIWPSAVLFAALEVGTRAMERNAGVAHEIVYVVQGCIILAMLIRGVQVLNVRAGVATKAAAAATEAAA